MKIKGIMISIVLGILILQDRWKIKILNSKWVDLLIFIENLMIRKIIANLHPHR